MTVRFGMKQGGDVDCVLVVRERDGNVQGRYGMIR